MRPERLLSKLTAMIVQASDPDQIVLFGSYAKGQQNADSDLDLLVVGDFKDSVFLRGRELRELVHRFPLRVDLLVVTPYDIAQEGMNPLGFLASVLASGRVLYVKEKHPAA